ncbi:hypothetical protein LCER1_G009428, partial [Lachnellula cervina]
YNTLKEVLITKLGFESLLSEASIFINRSIGVIITVYINDLAIIGPNTKNIKFYFEIKELGLIKDYLGINIDYKPKEGMLKLYIAKYINKILNKFGFNNLNSIKTLIDSNIKLESNKKQASLAAIKYF